MSKPVCPICGAVAVNAGKLRYCPACGWQKTQTERQLRINLKMMPIAFGVMTLMLVLLYARSGARMQNGGLIAVFFSFPLIALVVSYLITWRNLKRLLAQAAPSVPTGAATAAGRAAPRASIAPLAPQYEALLQTSPPRELRMSRRGRFNLSLTLIVMLIFAGIMLVQLYRVWAPARSLALFGVREWGMTGFALLLLLLLVWQWRAMDRERQLMTNGEVARARIVEKMGSRSASAIKYEFQDSSGHKHVGVGTDYSQKLDEGVDVPVFYDRENPQRQVPACGTFHEVVLPALPPQK
jgi:hypothetical protein